MRRFKLRPQNHNFTPSSTRDGIETILQDGAKWTNGSFEITAQSLMMIASGTMTNRIDQLVKAGLVERTTDAKEAR